MLKAGVALLAWLLLAAILVEAADTSPSSICRCLTGHRIEPGGKGVVLGPLRTEGLQVILTDASRCAPVLRGGIHPEPDSFVPDELHGADGFINGALLGLIHPQLVFEYQHGFPVWVWGMTHADSFSPGGEQA